MGRDELRQLLDHVARKTMQVSVEQFAAEYHLGRFDTHGVAHDLAAVLTRIGWIENQGKSID